MVGTSIGSVTATTLRAGLSATDLLARTEGRRLSPAGQRLMAAVGAPYQPPPRPPRAAPAPAGVAVALARSVVRSPLSVRPTALIAGLLPEGPVSTEAISGAIGELFSDTWPREQLWICAVRRRDGRRIVFGRGEHHRPPVPRAVAASCAIPGFFTPVEIDGDEYLDGGVHSPTNLDVLRHLELDAVVVSAPMSRRGGRRVTLAPGEAVRVWSKTLLDAEAWVLRRRRIPLVVFEPTEADLAAMGPNAMDPAIRSAVAAQAHRSTLDRLADPGADTAAALALLARRPAGSAG
jgi:NTE family protein